MAHKFVIIDEIMAQLEAAQTGLVPSSVKQSIVSGIQNVPSAILQHRVGGASSTCYTTFPLSPLSDNCCMDKTYLNLEFDVNLNLDAVFGTTLPKKHTLTIPFYIGFRDTASIFSQIQFLIEGTAIWQTVFQREESVCAYNSLPETEIRGNNQYASIDKMINGDYCPMKRVEIEITPEAEEEIREKTQNEVKVHFKCTVDINRLSPLFSNIHYTTPHMGNLRLKVFMQEIEKALFFCPDYSILGDSAKAIVDGSTVKGVENTNIANQYQYWQFYPLNLYFNEPIPQSKIPFVYYMRTPFSGEEEEVDEITCGVLTSVKFTNPIAPNVDFFTFRGGSNCAEIVQTNFVIKDEEYKRLSDYFASLGSVIIPTNVWSSNVFNNSNLETNNWNQSMIGSVSGYNFDSISVWTHPTGAPCCMTKQWLTDIQLYLEGQFVNAMPYQCYNDKFVTDMVQAIIDTDCEEINHDYMRSLTMFNQKNGLYYNEDNAIIPSLSPGGTLKKNVRVLTNPNTFVMNFSTNLPDAFHSGACILENTNKQANIRFNSTNITAIHSDDYPVITNIHNTPIVAGFSVLCDACIVLSYDPARGTCFSGQLSWAAPYAS